MREGVYLQRLEALEASTRDNTLTIGRQIARQFARSAALEELLVTGPETGGWLKSRCLLLKNQLLTLVAPGHLAALLTARENEIVKELRKQAEEAFLAKELERNRARTQAAKQPEQVEGPKKP